MEPQNGPLDDYFPLPPKSHVSDAILVSLVFTLKSLRNETLHLAMKTLTP